ncbi:hypothetical protein PFLUV_G00239110 [Perca fluviatilis]|uniref:Paired domain-containing protein n=1 Tax=Perca fluviatilis TaxID=8168 RepID=A0A6A5EBT5_PERFL|nr:hypothetical protein PFLUV_G00239110 [Perca fluviatilis]
MVTCKETRAAIIALHKNGFTGKDIVATKIAPKSTIYRIIKNFKKRGSILVKKASGRPRKSSKRQDRLLKRIQLRDRSATSAELAQEWQQAGDVLNNLDSCDLDDDDLMLDADLPEDASLHSDGDGIAHMAQWRMRQLCWGTQDIHSENESDFQCFKLTEDPGNKRTDTTGDSGLILDLCPPRSPCLSPGTPGLGLDVEEMAEDCSAVRSQLEYLQRILLQEEDVDEDTLTTDTLLSPDNESSSHSSDTQVAPPVRCSSSGEEL